MSDENWTIAYERAIETLMEEYDLEWDEAGRVLDKYLARDPDYIRALDGFNIEAYIEV
jgi:hypothetical protein